MCPGRHFVALEMLAVTAAMVMRFDLVPSGDRQELRVPEQKQNNLATNVFPPERDVRVRFSEREGWRAVKWEFVMS